MYPSALPISSAYDVVTAVTRAHALEATGQLPAAEAELRGIAARSAAAAADDSGFAAPGPPVVGAPVR